MIGRGIGQTQIICSLAKNNPEIKMTIDVNVQDTHPEEVEVIPYMKDQTIFFGIIKRHLRLVELMVLS